MGDRSLLQRVAAELVEANPKKIVDSIHWYYCEVANVGTNSRYYPQYLSRSMEGIVRQKVRKMRPETLGQIVDQGVDLNYDRVGRQGSSNWIRANDKGRDILREVACAAIIAQMAKIASSKMK